MQQHGIILVVMAKPGGPVGLQHICQTRLHLCLTVANCAYSTDPRIM